MLNNQTLRSLWSQLPRALSPAALGLSARWRFPRSRMPERGPGGDGLGRSGRGPIRNPQSAIRIWAVALVVAVSACTIEPQPIHLGSEECSHCRMIITDRQFAAQALNTKGRAFNFDAIECMAEWVQAGETVPAAELHSLWVMDFADSESWVAVEDAVFLRSDEVRSPMGMGLSAHASSGSAQRYQAELGGELLSWAQVLELVGQHRGHGHHHHASR
jgi:copper chaperone NosL